MALKSAVIRDPVVRMEYELEQWGRWIRSGNGRSGYGACVLASLRGSTVPEPNINDSRAETIDAAMLRLEKFDRQLWGALWHTFAAGLPPYKWAKLVGVGRQTAYYRLLPDAVRWMLVEVGVGEL